ncbi:MAG TPA: CpsD/CapB family tyrosine-protein kinase [Bryobacteraceae bacterium]|nr:CpsD/CapB family tyrosine-protein kinase [Bryobacteraceae bacterium]
MHQQQSRWLDLQDGGTAVPAPVQSGSPANGADSHSGDVKPHIHGATERSRRIGRTLFCEVLTADGASSDDVSSCAAEQYRIVRTRILQDFRRPRLIGITSATMGDGKTLNAINLALFFAHRSDSQVILLDADLRRPGVHRRLDLALSPGLADVLQGKCTLDEALCEVEGHPRLRVLTAGETDDGPAELFTSSRWPELIAEVRSKFHTQILDAPPLGVVADTDLLAAACDGLILVVRPDHTDRNSLRNVIPAVGKKLLGVLLNAVTDWALWRPYTPSYYRVSKRQAGKGTKS